MANDIDEDVTSGEEEKNSEEKQKSTSRLSDPVFLGLFGLVILLAVALVIFAYQAPTPTGQVVIPDEGTPDTGGTDATGDQGGSAKLTIMEFSEFQCPYCGAAAGFNDALIQRFKSQDPTWEAAVPKIKEEYGDRVDFQFKHFIVHATAKKASEASECARDQGKFWEMHDTLFQNAGALDVDDLKQYAADLGLDTETFNVCLDSGEKGDLVDADTAMGRQLGVSGTPTFIVGDITVVGAQSYSAIKETIEAALSGETSGTDSTGAEDVAEDPEFDIAIINDQNCDYDSCNTANIRDILVSLFPSAAITELDASESEASDLIEELGIEVLPAYVLDEDVAETASWKAEPRLGSSFDKVGSKYILKPDVVGATYYTDPQKRAEYEQELAEQEEKKKEALGIVEGDNKPQIDFFVMSYCPYGNICEEGIEPVFRNLGDKAIFNPRYVVYENYQGGGDDYCIEEGKYCSMHGVQELNQGLRELCVKKYMGTGAFFDFVLAMNEKCSYTNADTCWEAVAGELGLDTGTIKTCEEEEGAELAKADRELNVLLGVSGSPTVFIDGSPYNGARTPAAYQAAICAAFDTPPAECNVELSGGGDAVPQGQC